MNIKEETFGKFGNFFLFGISLTIISIKFKLFPFPLKFQKLWFCVHILYSIVVFKITFQICFSEELNRLYTMWQSRSSVPNIPISLMTLDTFKQHSRLIHYCHTPLLFLPCWRLQSAATRDHSLSPSSSNVSGNIAQLNNSIYKSDDGYVGKSNYVINEWHRELCVYMISEYKQYLQILGFNPVHTEKLYKS